MAQDMLQSLNWIIENDEDQIPNELVELKQVLHQITASGFPGEDDKTPDEMLKKLSELIEEQGDTAFLAWNYFHCLQKLNKYDDARAIIETLSWVRELGGKELTGELFGLRKQIDEYFENKATENLKE